MAPGVPTPTSPSLRNPTPTLSGSPNGRNHVATRERWRFRLRLNGWQRRQNPTSSAEGAVIGYKNLAQPSNKDKMAWVVGLKIGDNKKAGDFSIYGDYRQIGIASIDPNLKF